ncbi:UNKNOWN [Stylonychia lemnae]|uniref:RING-type domain-containing protein n=1 Tax=Stylonychia lemnae TaxID=5949 RepID=A0A078AYB9_STYLE|nr:UNKNOWN [Stylonychia lemnae]|eukprot:CDW85793.1 UNKNOWN [Stylonychia lemnae]
MISVTTALNRVQEAQSNVTKNFSCFICLESWDSSLKEVEQITLVPCNHGICWKMRGGQKCPLCQQMITHFITLNQANQQPQPFVSVEAIIKPSDKDQQKEALDGLDHKFFDDVILDLIRLRIKVQEQKFEIRGAKGTDEDWYELQSYKEEIECLQVSNKRLERFEPFERLQRIHNLNEKLLDMLKDLPKKKLNQEFLHLVNPNSNYQNQEQFGEIKQASQNKRGKKGRKTVVVVTSEKVAAL